MNKLIIWIIVALLVGVGAGLAFNIFGNSQGGDVVSLDNSISAGNPSEVSEESEITTEQETTTTPRTYTIEILSSGFSPSTLTINSGDVVTWTNRDSYSSHWPASAIHPAHSVYPETGGCIGSKFDACQGLSNGETYSFTFNEKGTWKYHDHLNPSETGTIIVS
ncbi:MAG: hypothetical protein AAB866_01640 [Patescibacteria group bacterium]